MGSRIISSIAGVSIHFVVSAAGENMWEGIPRFGESITYLDPQIPVSRPKLERSTGSFTSLAFAKNWLKTCIYNHQQCAIERPVRSPTRLLKFCSDGIRLFTPEKMDVSYHYSTLSHCWGKISMFKLTKSNIDALHQEIPVDSLCKTFQDAIIVTQALGLGYLWIDSLCIIQDDEHDWDQESATMADVYGNAVVNIAATNAIDGSAGLFVERSIVRASRQIVRTNTNESYIIMDRFSGNRCLDRTPLSRRAWAFQERYLARRTIHFTTEQIFCECRFHTACESFPEGLDTSVRNAFPTRDSSDEWRKIVEFYSRALLTMPKDKLVALSGVARQFQAKNRDQYCAGLWRKALELDLCWRIDREHPEQPPAQSSALQYRAPTWSWACTDYPLTYDVMIPYNTQKRVEVLCHVMGASFEPLTSDPLGQLGHGHLNINCGPLLNGSKTSPIFDDQYDFLRTKQEASDTTFRFGKYRSRFYYYFDSESARVTEDIYLLSVSNHIGPIVTTAERGGKGHFIRLGLFEFEFLAVSTRHGGLVQIPGATVDETLYAEILGPDENGIPQYSIILE